MTTKTLNYAVMSLAIVMVSACKMDYLDRYPIDAPSSSNFYTNEAELRMGLFGCYESLNFKVNGEPRPWITILDVTTDIDWNRSNSNMQLIGNGSHDSQNPAITQFWSGYYEGISRCNFLLDNIDNLIGEVSEQVYAEAKAEARFLRALNYHYLAELFGGVPLITRTLTLEEAQVPKSTKAEIVDFILTELDAIVDDLPLRHGADNMSGRATKAAALAIKARAALYNEQWAVAAEAAKAVIDLGSHSLHDNFQGLFTYSGQSSQEIILSLQYLRGVVTHTTPRFFLSRLAGGVSNEVPPQSIVDSYECVDGLAIDQSPLFDPQNPFENRDPRLGYTIALPGSTLFNFQFETHPDSVQVWNYNTSPATRVSNTDATHAFATFTGYLWRKYIDLNDRVDVFNSEINQVLIRYADVLLMYAEAKIEANDIDASVYEAINLVRQRPSVDMPPILPGKTQEELRSAVRKERKYEFVLEGLRLFDVRRWGIAEEVMSGPLYGRIRNAYLANAPLIDENGTPHYDNVTNRADMRVIEIKNFNPNRDYLWPIPNIDILTNEELVQNPGY